MTAEKSYSVTGMTCDHCVLSVAEEVGALAGVESVEVDLASGAMRVRGEGFGDEAIEAAVEEAGYALAGAAR
jgi:copper chaperone CopZ